MFIKRERGGRNHFLLSTLILVIALTPVVSGEGLRIFLHALLLLVLLSGAISAARHHGRAKLVGITAGSLIFLAYYLVSTYSVEAVPYVVGAEILFMLVVSLSLLGQVFAPGDITLDRIFGAISVYFLFGLSLGLLYVLIEILHPGSFSGRLLGTHPYVSDLIYFSYVTLTTLGYGDVGPASPLTRSLALMEAALGVLYMATLVARLVGLYPRQGGGA